MRVPFFRFVVFLVTVVGVASSTVFGFNLFSSRARVLVDAVATPEYEAAQAARGPDDIETYSLMQGKHFGGAIKDRSLERVPFQTVVDTLAINLKENNYYPSANPAQSDLLLIVHYGVTTVDEDWEDLMGITSIDEEAELYGDITAETNAETGETEFVTTPYYENFPTGKASTESNATLLGFNRQLRKDNITKSEEWDLLDALDEERYFIIVNAFDFRFLKETGDFKMLWSTRFSVRSPGTNFDEAHFALSKAAAPFFGQHLDDLQKDWTKLGTTGVDIGELEVVETDVETDSDDKPVK